MPTIKNYLSLVKFSHTVFAMPFALIGFALAVRYGTPIKLLFQNPFDFHVNGQVMHGLNPALKFYLKIFVLIIVCMVTARSAAMAFNRYLDRNFDAKNPRTALREIPRGIISSPHALRFVIINCILFIIATFFINKICFYLSPLALFVVLFYSYTKRFTPLCHLVLGMGLSLAPIGAYLAVTGEFAWLPLLFSFSVIFWVSGFDIIYALQDEDFDRENKLFSIPSAVGKKNALSISSLLHVLSAICVIFAGWYGGFGWLYWIGVTVFTGILIYQHSLVKPNDLSKVTLGFMTANGIASLVFSVFVISDIIF